MADGSKNIQTNFASRRAEDNRARLTQALIQTGTGDRAAFEDLYRATSVKLFGVCLRIFPERSEAEEALQDAYINIWNRAASFESGRASPISWLITVTRNRAIDRLRVKGKGRYVPLEDAAEIPDPAPLADEILLAGGQDKELFTCIETLDQKDRHFITAAFLQGSTYAELAESEGKPLGTVKSRIRRALIKLRECLGGSDGRLD